MAMPVPPVRDLVALWPETLMTVAACGALVADTVIPRARKRLIGWGCLIAVCVTLLFLLVLPPQGGSMLAGMFMADGYSAFFKGLFLISTALTVLISLRYLDDEVSHHGEYYALLLFATVGMMCMAGGGDLMTIYQIGRASCRERV